MFNVWSFTGLGAVVSSGLGGGSLIYANVLLRKPERWFVQEDIGRGGYESWPVTRNDLEPHYDRAEEMLNGQPFPFRRHDARDRGLPRRGGEAGLGVHSPEAGGHLRERRRRPRPSASRSTRSIRTSTAGRATPAGSCGECDIGCNFGSKNTLDYNYLSEAERLGAEIWTRSEVRSFAPREERRLRRSLRRARRRRRGPQDRHEPAGTPDARAHLRPARARGGHARLDVPAPEESNSFPGLGARLGTRFGGNGDLLTFAGGAASPAASRPAGP